MKKLVLVFFSIFVLSNISVIADNIQKQDTLKYRILLTDKSPTTYSLSHPEKFLSSKAIARRKAQHLSVDSTDLPVCDKYIKAITKKKVKIVAVGKWNNFVTVSCNNPDRIEPIRALPFVRSVELVWTAPKDKSLSGKRDSLTNAIKKNDEYYGTAYKQIKLCNGDKLHQNGYRGKGMEIAIVDAGYHNADVISALKDIHILGTRDFVNPGYDVFAKGSHGMCVLSIMGMNKPFYMVGTAPEASYLLLCSEDELSESLVEQDYWAEAVEYADSIGVDVINSSLGYNAFNDASKNYRYRDLDGKTALISRQASMIADKGMIAVISAGNDGRASWKKIGVPADAYNILTVGAVDVNGNLATFSSVGNTADGRIKPDVSVMGSNCAIMKTNGELGFGSGTSFSSPLLCGLVACLWQSCPQLTAKQIINIVQKSGDRADFPDNIYGYGIPDIWKAYEMGQKLIHKVN